MRKPNALKTTHSHAQQGFALFIVLVMMMVIALLVVAAAQSYNTEQRISSNDSDRKFATTLAEAALHEGENRILDFEENAITFKVDCSDGLCTAENAKSPTGTNITVEGSADTPAWKRKCDDSFCIDTNGTEYQLDKSFPVSKNPRYIVEYINTNESGAMVFRVTSKAWGRNNNTVVMLQSYVSNDE